MEPNMSKILRLPEVMSRTGLSRSSIYAYMAKSTFPLHIHLGARSVGWLENELQEWLTSRTESSRKQGV